MAFQNAAVASGFSERFAFRRSSFLRARPLETERTASWFHGVVGAGSALWKVLDRVEKVGPTDSTVLLEGETGTGKEVIARAVHELSARKNGPLVKVNCAAMPAALLESELFGHERGAFTGAVTRRAGRFEAANGGTLFLDEIGDMPLELQSKLLRVLQEREFERLGSSTTVRVNVRVVAATNQDLRALVESKAFRMDLFYRLNVFPLLLPPLRERRGDIPPLAQHFVSMFSQRVGKEIDTIPGEALKALTSYSWPGNVRELQNIIERSVVETTGRVFELCDLPHANPPKPITLEDAERDHILKALQACNWVVAGPSGAAARLGMKRTTLIHVMKRRGISREISIVGGGDAGHWVRPYAP
jgi:formate hydrogenlyase transcriptional activator